MTQGLLVILWHYLCQLLLCQLLMSFLTLPLFTCPCAWISCPTIFRSAMGQSSFIYRSVKTTYIHSVQKDLPHYFCILFLSSLPISHFSFFSLIYFLYSFFLPLSFSSSLFLYPSARFTSYLLQHNKLLYLFASYCMVLTGNS